MPDITPNSSLPFPLSSEPVAAGYQNIQDLAEAADAPWGVFSRTTDQSIAGGGFVGAQFADNGAGSSFTSEFSLADDGFFGVKSRVVYTGPTRWFIVSFTPTYYHNPELGGYLLEDRYDISVTCMPTGGIFNTLATSGPSVTLTGLLIMTSGDYLVTSVATAQADDAQLIRPVLKVKALV